MEKLCRFFFFRDNILPTIKKINKIPQEPKEKLLQSDKEQLPKHLELALYLLVRTSSFLAKLGNKVVETPLVHSVKLEVPASAIK